jgi:hypothetical protein
LPNCELFPLRQLLFWQIGCQMGRFTFAQFNFPKSILSSARHSQVVNSTLLFYKKFMKP